MTRNKSFPNKNKNEKKIIYYPEKVITGQKSDGISSSEVIEMHYFDSVNKKGLQVPGA